MEVISNSAGEYRWNVLANGISKSPRAIIDAILDGSIDEAPTQVVPLFNLEVPTELGEVSPEVLDPRGTYADALSGPRKRLSLLACLSITSRSSRHRQRCGTVEAGPKL